MNTQLRRYPRKVPLTSMTPQAVLQNTSHYSRIAKSGTSWNKCHLRRSMAAEGLFSQGGSVLSQVRPDLPWVMRPFPVDTFWEDIAAKSEEHPGTLLWAKCFTLNAHCEKIFLEIWRVNLIHTLKTGTYFCDTWAPDCFTFTSGPILLKNLSSKLVWSESPSWRPQFFEI